MVLDRFWNLAMYIKWINLPESKLDANVSKALINSELIDWALMVQRSTTTLHNYLQILQFWILHLITIIEKYPYSFPKHE